MRAIRFAVAALSLLLIGTRADAAPTDAAPSLAYDTFACWFGPVWGDALGEPIEQRKDNATERCRSVASRVSDGRDYKGDVERLRALETTFVAALIDRVDGLGRGALPEADRTNLVKLVRVAAGAQRDNMWARRAADKIKLDENDQRPRNRISGDERAALDPLLKTEGLRALVQLQVGQLTADAHALGVLTAMDRMETARGLPRHLEIYAAAPMFAVLFGTKMPPTPSDATAEVAPHLWIAYLARTATAARHAIPATATRAEDRDRLAWAGVLEGVADQLARDAPRVSLRLRPIVDGTIRRLQAEAIGARNAFAAGHATAEANINGSDSKRR